MTAMRVNGKSASRIDLLDRGFQYGDGVFTTLLVQDGVPLFLERHFERLTRDCQRLAIPPFEWALLRQDVMAVLGDQRQGVIKIQITRGAGGRGYRTPGVVSPARVVVLHPPSRFPDQYSSAGIEARYCHVRLGINASLAGIKHMNRLEQVLARSEWQDNGVAEGLMLDHEGLLVEGTMSNVFLVKGRQLQTPRLDRCGVAGVMRSIIISAASTLGLSFSECRLTPAAVDAADEVFLTNSIIRLWPIRCLEGKSYPVGPVTCELRDWLKQTVTDEISRWSRG